MTRRYEYPVTVQISDPSTFYPPGVTIHDAIQDAFRPSGRNVEVTVGEPVDVTPKSAADRAEDAISVYLATNHPWFEGPLVDAVRAAVGEETP